MSSSKLFAAATLLAIIPALPGQEKGTPDLRVRVTLKNGAILSGVAKQGRLVERPRPPGYESSSDTTDRSSGLRLWSYRGSAGYIFLPYRSILEVTELGPVDRAPADDGSTSLLSRQRRAAPKATVDAGRGKGEARPKSSDSLLREFPPDAGWSARRLGDIQRRRIVLEIPPTPRERRFVQIYEEWSAARERARRGRGPRDMR